VRTPGHGGLGQDNQDVHTLTGTDLVLFRLQSSLCRPSTVKELYSGLGWLDHSSQLDRAFIRL
jgi:hypothetical protein